MSETGGNGHGEAVRGSAGRRSGGGGSSGCAVDGSEDAVAAVVVAAAFAELVDTVDRKTEAPAAAGGGRCEKRSGRVVEKSKHLEDRHLVCRAEVRCSADNSTGPGSGSGSGSGCCSGDPSTNG